MQIKDVMTDNVSFVGPQTPIVDVARLMRDEDIGVVPVAENDKLVGMVTDRDIVVRAVADGVDVDVCSASDVMSPHVFYCMEDNDVKDVLKNMGEQQIRRLPVVNREKRLVGMVSIGDLSSGASTARTGEALKEISRPVSH